MRDDNDESSGDWEHDIKPGYALVWWTTAAEALDASGSPAIATWPAYLQRSFGRRLWDHGPDSDTALACCPRRKLKVYVSRWFDLDGIEDLLNDADALPGAGFDRMVGVIVRESHAALVRGHGFVTDMDLERKGS
jgi:hypothetical protein